MKKVLFLIPLFLFALDNIQLKVLQDVYKIASKFKAKDGHIFNDTMSAIVLTETSAGKYLIGDNYYPNKKEKYFLLKSLGVGQVKLETAILMIKKYPKIFKKYNYLNHKDPFAFKKYVSYLENIRYFQNILSRYIKKIHKTKRDKKNGCFGRLRPIADDYGRKNKSRKRLRTITNDYERLRTIK